MCCFSRLAILSLLKKRTCYHVRTVFILPLAMQDPEGLFPCILGHEAAG
jgi:hypothetical protein